ncbi:par-3 family cell polarity regulator isoform X2 [Arctopsyche grandis]|uniref:par-3 family cell polarity regulator isoform X2 n=1 Tax=Arctopsyche grandis TaxID=121162 RepID=UPI00406D7F17
MKVTVCFGSVRVLVPCGGGQLLVRELVAEATRRYRNATGKGSESWIVVRNLRSETGGILDPDDQLKDVADDRETLVATLEGRHDSHLHHGGDGASGSSVGTASPDLFRGGNGLGVGADACGVEVGAGGPGEMAAGGLQVRRGSEPTLNQDNIPLGQPTMAASKRWSAAVVFRDMTSSHMVNDNMDSQLKDKQMPIHNDSNKLHSHLGQPFQRQTNRLSMQFSGPGSGNWIDAADRVQVNNTKSLPRDSARKEPLGQDTSVINSQNHRVEDMLRWVSGVNNNLPQMHMQERPLDRLPEIPVNSSNLMDNVNGGMEIDVGVSVSSRGGQLTTVLLVKGERGLGFTITTRDNPTGGICPIYIKNILPKGAAVTDGRLRAGDRMVSVNGVSVSGLSQQQVVTLLRNTPTHSTVTIVVERPQTAAVQTVSAVHNRTQRVEPQPNYNKYRDMQDTGSPKKTPNKDDAGRVSSMVHAINQNHNSSMRGHIRKSSSKDDILYREQVNKSDQSLQDALNSSNTVLGLRHRSVMRLDIPVYDSEKAGLGISVKGKVTVGSNPQDLGIFIKSVLNGGAASRDGRLHTNDQLLNINGVSLVGQSNAEAMETLRRALVHTRSNIQGNISLTIARRTESMDSIARWKDDTPPNVNESSNSNDNILTHSQSFSPSQNTVIYNSNSPHKSINSNLSREQNKSVVMLDSNYNKSIQVDSNLSKVGEQHIGSNNINSSNSKKHSSIVNINNNNTTWINDKVEDSRNFQEMDNKLRETSDRDAKRDSFEWGRLDGWNPVIDRLTGLRNVSYCLATQDDSTILNGGREHVSRAMHPPNALRHNLRSSQPQHNVIIEEDYGSNKNGPGGVWESGSESGCGNDAIGFSRDAVGRRSMSEKRHAAMDAKNTGTYKKLKEQRSANSAAPVGPSLGMRKSSSLESLQTAIQEVTLHGHHHLRQNDPLYGRVHQPRKHWLTDNGNEGMVRGTPTQSSLTHKKPSIFKSLSSMLGFGKQRPKISETRSEIYSSVPSRSHPGRASEKSLKSDAIERLQQEAPPKNSDGNSNSDGTNQARRNEQQPIHNGTHSRQPSSDRLADGEDRLVDSRGMQWVPPYRHPPSRTGTGSHTVSQVMEGPWGGDHYVNYDEIQQNLNARRERLSEVQIGQMRRQVHAQRVKAEEESRRGAVGGYHSQRAARGEIHRPQSNFYEYESIQHARPINAKLTQYH